MELTSDCYSVILSFFEFKDLVIVCQCSKKLYEIAYKQIDKIQDIPYSPSFWTDPEFNLFCKIKGQSFECPTDIDTDYMHYYPILFYDDRSIIDDDELYNNSMKFLRKFILDPSIDNNKFIGNIKICGLQPIDLYGRVFDIEWTFENETKFYFSMRPYNQYCFDYPISISGMCRSVDNMPYDEIVNLFREQFIIHNNNGLAI